MPGEGVPHLVRGSLAECLLLVSCIYRAGFPARLRLLWVKGFDQLVQDANRGLCLPLAGF
jgi:hypothetical protein